MQNIRVKRFNKDIPLPKFETPGSVGFDLIARDTVTVYHHRPSLIPANIAVEVPRGYALLITLRSSTPRKFDLMMPHGIGVIDQDYCGNEDEVLIQVQKISPGETTVKRGDRIAQGIFVLCQNYFHWTEVRDMRRETRGGFGSTDENQ